MFIEIEGIDGSGKSTQCLLLQDWMTRNGMESIITKDLSNITSFSKEIKRLLLEEKAKNSLAEMFLFLSCKSQVFSQVIMPYLAQGKNVISDRGGGSFISYTSIALDLDRNTLIDFLSIARLGIEPTMTILLDIPVETTLERIDMKIEKTRFDMVGEKHLTKQRNNFVELSHYFPHWVLIDGSLPAQDVHLEVIKHIEKIIRGT